MTSLHAIGTTFLAIGTSVSLAAGPQQPSAAALPATASHFTIFFRGVPVGTEQVSLTRGADGWTILSTGRVGAPFDITARRVQVKYTADWKPLDLTVDATVKGQAWMTRTTVGDATATSTITIAGLSTERSATIAADSILLPEGFFGPYEAVSARLKTAAAGSTLPVHAVPGLSFSLQVGEASTEQIQTTARLLEVRRTHVTLLLPALPLEAEIWSDEAGRLLRITVPAQNLDIIREDIASVAARRVTVSRPNDESVKIAANGFSLAGTLSKPTGAINKLLPAVVLVGGSGSTDRDELVWGIPIFGQLAGAIADAGFAVLRYDKRGFGQSGGRLEAASFADFADDLRSAVAALAARKDIDRKRIAVVGHGEGAAVAMIAAAKEKRIAALALVAARGVTGSELVLAQQARLLSRSTLTDTEKQAKVELQKQINDAAITGKGLDRLPPEVRRQVDDPEFQSMLTHDPAKTMANVRQPILIVHGDLDTEVAPSNADRLETLARARKKAPPVEVMKVPGINHLLVPAITGEPDEYSTLKDKRVGPAVSAAIASWLTRIFTAAR